MRDILEFTVPAVFLLLFFALFLGFFGWLRWMRFRETLALADRGYAPVVSPNGTNRTLRWGLILAAIGLALSCGMAPITFESIDRSPVLIPGLLFLFLGLALLLYWLMTGGRSFLRAQGGLVPLPPPVWPGRDDDAPGARADAHDRGLAAALDDATEPVAATDDGDNGDNGDDGDDGGANADTDPPAPNA